MTTEIVKNVQTEQPNDATETKQCTKCHNVKPISEFHRRKASRDGLAFQCKDCALLRYRTHQVRWTKAVGRKTICVSCQRQITMKPTNFCSEQRHKNHYQKKIDQGKEHRKKVHFEALVRYSGHSPPQCVLCGYDNVLALQFDHINGDGAAFRRVHPDMGGKYLAIWLKNNGWPEGYRVLCANCQWIERNRLNQAGTREQRAYFETKGY